MKFSLTGAKSLRMRRLVLPTAVSVLATVVTAWYQTERASRITELAEYERRTSAQAQVVDIVEGYVIEKKYIDSGTINRLISTVSKKKKLESRIDATHVLGLAEFNILHSRYLSNDQKESYRDVLAKIYSEMRMDPASEFGVTPYADTFTVLRTSIRGGEIEKALSHLAQLEAAIKEKGKKEMPPRTLGEGALSTLFRSPVFLGVFVVAYTATLLLLNPNIVFKTLKSWMKRPSSSDRES